MAYSATGTFNGLGTTNLGVPTAGNYEIAGSITLPTIPEGESANSQVVVTIAINGGGAIYTGPAGSKGYEVKTPLSANDVIHITLTSSAPIDQGLNKIKQTIVVVQI